MTITLEITGPYPPEGGYDPVFDEIRYNDTVMSPHGEVGHFRTMPHPEGGLLITQADPIALFRRGFPDEWTVPTDGFSLQRSPFGFSMMKIEAINGSALYKLLEDKLEWGDIESPLDNYQLALRYGGDWTPWVEIPTGKRTVTKTEQAVLQQREDRL